MIKLPKDLQKQNFYDALKTMLSVPGWEIFEEHGLLALKAPTRLPFVNMVWGDATKNNIENVTAFFSKHSFVWYLTQKQRDNHLLQAGFEKRVPVPEMVFLLNSYPLTEPSLNINVRKVTSDSEFRIWAEVASEAFRCKPEEIKEFYYPLIKVSGGISYLGFYENEPASTSFLFCHKQIAGIYAMSTREQYRRKGLGRAVATACLKAAKRINIPYAVLYASQQGKLLYDTMGFQTVQKLREYYFK